MALNLLRLSKQAGTALCCCRRILSTPNSFNFLETQKKYSVPEPNLTPIRHCTNFFNKLPADHLWKSVTSVSNQGAKKGRGRGAARRRTKDLNKGQVIGVGSANIVWPGLTAPVVQGNELVRQQKLPEDPERQAKLIKLRDQGAGFRFLKLSPLERGWSGTKMPGRSLGKPDPIGEDTFEGFETKCLVFRALMLMRGHLGRVRRMCAVAVTGNKQGLAGFAKGKSLDGQTALRKARNRAAQRLMHINLFENHTVYHDFYTQFGRTKIFVSKKPKGYGLKCHRAIKTMCEVIGIKDLHAKVEGSINVQHIMKAFFIGLLRQKTHQQIAEEKKLYLVEYRKENEYFPTVVGAPKEVRSKVEPNEVLDFTQYVMDNRVVLRKKKAPPFFTRLPSWDRYLKKYEKRRSHDPIRMNLWIKRGELKSFLNDNYDVEESKTEEASAEAT